MADVQRDRLLAGLTEPQRAAVTSDAALLCVRAGAGSGKTTVLTRRVAWRVSEGAVEPEHALVVTFTRKAAVELRQRLARLGVTGVTAATFHAAAYAQLRRRWADQGRRPPVLAPEPQRMVRRLLEEQAGADTAAEAAGAVVGELSWARARMVDPRRYPAAARAARRTPPLPLEQVAELMARYADEKRRRRVVDFDDLVLLCIEALESDGAFAAAVRWQLRHLFVDEFQDVNPAQWRLLEAWRSGRPELCVVGDGRQAIYSWNGSDPTLIDRIADLVPGTVVMGLDENHRSTPQIVSAALTVLGPVAGGGPSTAAGGPSTAAGGPSTAAGGPSTAADDGPLPRLGGYHDEQAEAAAVVSWLRTIRRPGHPWRHVAVLARTHSRLDPVAKALDAAGIPTRRPGGPGRAPGWHGALRLLRSMPGDMALRAALVDAAAELGGAASSQAAGPGPGSPDVMELLSALADEHAAQEGAATVGSFLAWSAANGAEAGVAGAEGVELLSFHQAKGLEWRAVAVIGLETGTMPIAYALDDLATAEERRLLYVAMTRAQQALWCSWAAQRSGAAATGDPPRSCSPFLSDLPGLLARAGPLPPAAALAHLAGLRSRLAAAG